jgi:hypothetical protein
MPDVISIYLILIIPFIKIFDKKKIKLDSNKATQIAYAASPFSR